MLFLAFLSADFIFFAATFSLAFLSAVFDFAFFDLPFFSAVLPLDFFSAAFLPAFFFAGVACAPFSDFLAAGFASISVGVSVMADFALTVGLRPVGFAGDAFGVVAFAGAAVLAVARFAGAALLAEAGLAAAVFLATGAFLAVVGAFRVRTEADDAAVVLAWPLEALEAAALSDAARTAPTRGIPMNTSAEAVASCSADLMPFLESASAKIGPIPATSVSGIIDYSPFY